MTSIQVVKSCQLLIQRGLCVVHVAALDISLDILEKQGVVLHPERCLALKHHNQVAHKDARGCPVF